MNQMTEETVKRTIQRTFPTAVTYVRAGVLKTGKGWSARKHPRIIGRSPDNRLSVEIVGRSAKLRSVNLMLSADDASRLPILAYTAVSVVKALVDDETGDWVSGMLGTRQNGQRGRVRVEWTLMPSAQPFPLAFVEVTGGGK